MKTSDLITYVGYALIAFVVYFIAVPALISAKSTLAVIVGVVLIVAAVVFVINYAYKAFTQKEVVKDE